MRERLVFDVCGAPFGSDFFFSLRASEIPLAISPVAVILLVAVAGAGSAYLVNEFGWIRASVCVLAVVLAAVVLLRQSVALGIKSLDATLIKTFVLGPIYERFFRKETFFREDARLMYLYTVRKTVIAISEEITAAKGVKLVAQFESRPIFGELYKPVNPAPPDGATIPVKPKAQEPGALSQVAA
jgi:hypothetical protein